MVNPLDFIPKLSGFSPMPLGIMAPFMGYQSAALAYNFGLNYEFGKRVIKSMSNEKFNKIAEDPILLNELTSRHHDVLLKAFIHEVPKVDKIQDLIIKKMVELEFAKIKVMPELIAQIPKGFIEGIFALGGGGSPEDLERPEEHGTPKRPPREPAKPILPKKPSEPKPRRLPKAVVRDFKWHYANSQGMLEIFIGSTTTLLYSRSGLWRRIKTGNKEKMLMFARASWPQSGYKEHGFQFRGAKLKERKFWTLSSKFP